MALKEKILLIETCRTPIGSIPIYPLIPTPLPPLPLKGVGGVAIS